MKGKLIFVFLAGVVAGLYFGEMAVGAAYQTGWSEGYAESTRLHQDILIGYQESLSASSED